MLTICTYGRMPLFGRIINGVMMENAARLMVKQKLTEIPEYYPGIVVDAFCVMPNHVNAIVRIRNKQYPCR